MLIKKNIKLGKVKLLLVTFFTALVINNILADVIQKSEMIAELSVLDKVH